LGDLIACQLDDFEENLTATLPASHYAWGTNCTSEAISMTESSLPSVSPDRIFDVARLELAQLNPNSDVSLQSVFQRICELTSETLQVERAGIWILVEERTALRCVNLYERSKRQHSEGATLRVADFPNYFSALEHRKAIPAAIAASDPQTAELFEPYLKPLKITSMLDAPIFLGGKVAGVVCHEHVLEPRSWTNEQRDFASAVSDIVAVKMRSAELVQAQAVQRQLSSQLSEYRRMESLGQLAAGIAHDFKNLLAMIIGSAGLLNRKTGLPAGADQLIKHIVEAAERGSSLTDDLMQYARNNTRATKVVRVEELVKQFLPLLRRAVGSRHEINLQTTAPQGQVLIEGASLERVLMNLVLNARDSMGDGGIVDLRLNGNARPTGDDTNQIYVCIEVSDHGNGMNPEIIEHIFEPFFTTKGNGKGTGLGLAVVKQIVDRSGGFIKVHSEVGKGTTFSVYLPRITSD
jgi:two-component system, cell cycle sensor histidine kinase and response regulator CckA